MHPRSVKKTPRGVTLIETLLYVFIFAMIVGGGIAAAFYTYESSAKTGRVALTESETDFVLRKLAWATTGSAIVAPAPGATSTALSLSRDGTTYTFALTGNTLFLATNGGTPVPLTTDNVSIDGFSAAHIAANGTVPEAASTTLSVNGKTYGPKIQYVR